MYWNEVDWIKAVWEWICLTTLSTCEGDAEFLVAAEVETF